MCTVVTGHFFPVTHTPSQGLTEGPGGHGAPAPGTPAATSERPASPSLGLSHLGPTWGRLPASAFLTRRRGRGRTRRPGRVAGGLAVPGPHRGDGHFVGGAGTASWAEGAEGDRGQAGQDPRAVSLPGGNARPDGAVPEAAATGQRSPSGQRAEPATREKPAVASDGPGGDSRKAAEPCRGRSRERLPPSSRGGGGSWDLGGLAWFNYKKGLTCGRSPASRANERAAGPHPSRAGIK